MTMTNIKYVFQLLDLSASIASISVTLGDDTSTVCNTFGVVDFLNSSPAHPSLVVFLGRYLKRRTF